MVIIATTLIQQDTSLRLLQAMSRSTSLIMVDMVLVT